MAKDVIKKIKIKLQNEKKEYYFKEVPLSTDASLVSVVGFGDEIKNAESAFNFLQTENSEIEKRLDLLEAEDVKFQALIGDSQEEGSNITTRLGLLEAEDVKIKENYTELASYLGEQLNYLQNEINLINETDGTFIKEEFSPLKETTNNLSSQLITINNKIGAIPDQFSSVMDAVKNINIAVGIDADKDYIWTDDVIPVFDRLDSIENHIGLGLVNPTDSLDNKVNLISQDVVQLGNRVNLLEQSGIDLSDFEMRLMNLENTYEEAREAMAKMENVYAWKTDEFQTWKDQVDVAQNNFEQELQNIKDILTEIQLQLA